MEGKERRKESRNTPSINSCLRLWLNSWILNRVSYRVLEYSTDTGSSY